MVHLQLTYQTDLLPHFITTFLLLKTESIITIVSLRPHDERFLNNASDQSKL